MGIFRCLLVRISASKECLSQLTLATVPASSMQDELNLNVAKGKNQAISLSAQKSV
jgi:hypothetical protein